MTTTCASLLPLTCSSMPYYMAATARWLLHIQERAAALEALATIQDGGVLLGNVQPEHVLVQRNQVQPGRPRRFWSTCGAVLYRHNEGPKLLPRRLVDPPARCHAQHALLASPARWSAVCAC